MSWLDAFTMASREVRRRPGRALLTMLAVALAAALLTALLAVAGTAKTRVLSQLSHGGSLAGITVEPDEPNPAEATLDDPVPGPPRAITPQAIAAISRLRGVDSVLPVVSAPAEVLPPVDPPTGSTLCAHAACDSPLRDVVAVSPLTPIIATSVIGAPLGLGTTLPVTLLAGRLPLTGTTNEVVVGEQYLTSLGIDTRRASEVVGTRAELANQVGPSPVSVTRVVTVEIVGVVDEQLTAGDVVGSPALVDGIYASENDGGASSGETPPIASAIVIAKQLTDVQAVRAGIAGVGYSTTAPVGLILSVGRYLHVVELVLSGIGLVALLIAALGIANALFAAVRERRREIGVMKAIGARDRDVLRVFLVEAAALGVAGGICGTIAGLVMAAAIGANANAYLHTQGLAGVSLSIPWLLPAGCIVGSAVVALLAGFFPARRASRLPAREAVEA